MARDSHLPRLLLVLSLVLMVPHSSALAPIPAPMSASPVAPACAGPASRILADERSALVSIDPVSGTRVSIPVRDPRRVVALHPSGLVLVEDSRSRWVLVSVTGGAAMPVPEHVAAALRVGLMLSLPAPRWVVEQQPLADTIVYRVLDRSTGALAVTVSFPRRIELATSASSPDGRFFVHVQANNVASDVVIIDASTKRRRSGTLPHDARLAAFAMSLTFSPNASCLAISMEREGEARPATWTIDLTAGVIAPRRVDVGSVLAWVATGE